MKTLIVFYSRTGTTRKVAEYLADKIDGDIEEITDLKARQGAINYMIAGKDATQKNLTEIAKNKKDPKKYDMIILGTPIWAWTITPAIRTYIHKHKEVLKKKHLAFLCTMGGSGDKNSFNEMQLLSGKPKATVALLTKEVWKDEYKTKIEEFTKKIKKRGSI